MLLTRPIVRLAMCLLAASLASACNTGGTNDRIIHIGLQDDFKSLDPAIGYDIPTWGIYHMLYETLVTYDFESKVVPSLAASWKLEDSGKRYVFTLRDGAKFSNGHPLTAKDVVYSFNRMLDPTTKSPGASFYTGIVGAEERLAGKATTVSGVTAPDDKTVKIALKAPNQVFLQLLAMPFASSVPEGAKNDDMARNPVGSGPYRFTSWTSGQSVKLARNTDFTGYASGGPSPDGGAPEGVEYVLGVNENLEVLRFERGDLDVIGANRNIPAADYARLSEDPTWQSLMLKAPDAAFHYVTMNCKVAPFDKLEVRQAIASAVDKKHIVQLVNGRGEVASGILPPPMPGYDAKLPGIPYDPAKAKELLAKAGLPNGFSGTYYCVSNDTETKISQAIQSDLAKIGVKLDLKPLAFPTYLDAKATPGRVAIGAGNWSQDFPDPSNFLTTMFHSKNIKPTNSLNDSYYKNPKVDALLDAAETEADTAKRLEDFHQAEMLIVADAPVLPLYYPVKVQLHAKRVTGYRLHPIWGVELAGVGIKP